MPKSPAERKAASVPDRPLPVVKSWSWRWIIRNWRCWRITAPHAAPVVNRMS